MENVVFVGNGINKSQKMTMSWKDLLVRLSTQDDLAIQDQLPNTMGYEYVECKALNSGRFDNIEAIKHEIAKAIREKIPSGKKNYDYDWSRTLQHRLTSIPVSSFITTNYDYALELSLDTRFKAQHITNERTYSLKRKTVSGGKNFYHIHGECDRLDTICLGFEHYAGSLEKMRNILVKSTSGNDDKHKFHLYDVLSGIEKPEEDYWFYRFFTDNLYFIGFGLDESEIDIWWLLSYRYHAALKGEISIQNHIYFLDTESEKVRKNPQYQAKLSLLKQYGIEVITILGNGYPARYKRAIEFIEGRCN